MATQNKMITTWLQEPYRLSVVEQQQVADLLKLYPYLVPARWMQASKSFAKEGFTKDMLHDSQLFMGGWMQFYVALNDSKQAEKPIHTTEAISAVANNTDAPSEIGEELSEERIESTEAIMVDESQPFIQNDKEIELAETAILIADEEEKVLNEEESLLLDELINDEETTHNSIQEQETAALELPPVFAENYFLHQGIEVPDVIPVELDKAPIVEEEEVDVKSLMVMMGFDEWLSFLKRKKEDKLSDEEDKAIVRSIWQREKLAAAMGEEDDNIPEAVFEMAINSINKQEIMVSEPLAEIHIKQGRFDKAIEIYRKLSLQNPEKKTYFAAKINHLNKEKLL